MDIDFNDIINFDELDIINFLFNQKKIIYKSILHIGIGNSYFASKFSKTSKITGISISQKEIETISSLGFKNVSLGDSRFRTETAGIIACHTVSIVNM